MPIAAESLLMPFILIGLNVYAADDKKYSPNARPATINRLGPSGSLKRRKSILEQMMAVAAKITSEVLFDLKYKFAMLSAGFIT